MFWRDFQYCNLHVHYWYRFIACIWPTSKLFPALPHKLLLVILFIVYLWTLHICYFHITYKLLMSGRTPKSYFCTIDHTLRVFRESILQTHTGVIVYRNVERTLYGKITINVSIVCSLSHIQITHLFDIGVYTQSEYHLLKDILHDMVCHVSLHIMHCSGHSCLHS